MLSSVMECVASNNSSNNHEDGNEQFDFLRSGGDPTVRQLLLPPEAFLKAAISLKEQVYLPFPLLPICASLLLELIFGYVGVFHLFNCTKLFLRKCISRFVLVDLDGG